MTGVGAEITAKEAGMTAYPDRRDELYELAPVSEGGGMLGAYYSERPTAGSRKPRPLTRRVGFLATRARRRMKAG